MAATVPMDPFVRSTSREVAVGWLYGLLPAEPLPTTSKTARAALDHAILPALLRGPCYVTFSGGRDSSAVLAAATDLARREGLQLPIPVTRVYPDLPDTDESTWQNLVIKHLGLSEWIRLEFRHGETDLLGVAAKEGLRRHGLIWPVALQPHGAMFERLGPGSLMSGEGGDAVLGRRRGTALTVLRSRRLPSRLALQRAVRSLLPRPVRQAMMERDLRQSMHSRWLQPAALAEHARTVAAEEAAEPLRYDESTWFLTRRRSFAVGVSNHAARAAEYGIITHDPLLDRGFIAALARSGQRWGFRSRTAAMQALFTDVLPKEVLSRPTKARFNQAHTGSATRDFARTWDGSGVDPELVDVARLRDVWLSDEPTMGTGMLLHSAWLATEEGSA
mgnify:CR=1 FL=1